MVSRFLVPTLTAERARELLTYDPLTGVAVWNEARGCVPKGKEAGCLEKEGGYVTIRIDDVQYRLHQIVFLIAHGHFAKGFIDHINGKKNDNRIENLRDVSRSENARNSKLPAHNKSGFVGVFWNNSISKWTARVKINQKNIALGDFDDFNKAVEARKAANVIYGFTDRHGSK